MGDIIKDRNGKSLDGGMYTDWDGLGDPTSAKFYLVYAAAGWKAVDPEQRISKLGVPQGMPDSARMPEGTLDVTKLSPVSPDKINEIYPQFERRNRSLMATTGLLAEVADLARASESGEHLSQEAYEKLVKKYSQGSVVRL